MSEANEVDGVIIRQYLERVMDCKEKCQRIHPHCTLEITRSIAPDSLWHWIVTMPDGHCWEIKGGFSFEDALESMKTDGIKSLLWADDTWRKLHCNVDV